MTNDQSQAKSKPCQARGRLGLGFKEGTRRREKGGRVGESGTMMWGGLPSEYNMQPCSVRDTCTPESGSTVEGPV